MKYEEMLPHQLDEMLRTKPIAWVPWGALEWHGRHLAIGNDALKAHALLLRAAERAGGAVLPPVFCGHHTMILYGAPHTIEHDVETVRRLALEYLTGLTREGFKAIVVLTGHYGRQHVEALKAVCERVSRSNFCRVWCLAEYEVATDLGYTGDHAGKWETSILWHLRPELVDLSQLNPDPDVPLEGVHGDDPRLYASPELGAQVCEAIVQRLADSALGLLAEARRIEGRAAAE